MNANPLDSGKLARNVASIGPITRAMVQARSQELAVLAGRTPPYVTQVDYLQARRELTGESDMDRQDAIIEALPATKHHDRVPGSDGPRTLESPREVGVEDARRE